MEKIDILFKEYDIMRTEIRMYINKFYLALTAILAIVTAGVFKSEPDRVGFIWIYIPYLISAIIGFMTMVTFFVNKTAGYVRLIEERINNHFKTSVDALQVLKETVVPPTATNWTPQPVPILFWENFYADVAMDRDKGGQLKALHALSYIAIVLGALAVVVILIGAGCVEADKWEILGMPCRVTSILHAFMSVLSISLAGYFFWYVQTSVRKTVIKLNKSILYKEA